MRIWIRIALIAGLAILLWILVVDLSENVDDANGSLEPSAPGSAPLNAP